MLWQPVTCPISPTGRLAIPSVSSPSRTLLWSASRLQSLQVGGLPCCYPRSHPHLLCPLSWALWTCYFISQTPEGPVSFKAVTSLFRWAEERSGENNFRENAQELPGQPRIGTWCPNTSLPSMFSIWPGGWDSTWALDGPLLCPGDSKHWWACNRYFLSVYTYQAVPCTRNCQGCISEKNRWNFLLSWSSFLF